MKPDCHNFFLNIGVCIKIKVYIFGNGKDNDFFLLSSELLACLNTGGLMLNVKCVKMLIRS
jgi:hypothetical protein